MKRNRRVRRQRRSLAKRIVKHFGWRGLHRWQSGEWVESQMRRQLAHREAFR